jgi:hypothetical protein
MMPTFTPSPQFYPLRAGSESAVPRLEAFQAKAVLAEHGLLDAVQAIIDHVDTPIKIKLAWENSVPFRRDNPMILLIASQLELTESELDTLFAEGALITADEL